MIIVIGLGNPGPTHAGQRHNVGWMALDAIAAKEGLHFEEKKIFSAEIAQFGQLLLVKPQTFMNDSGITARALIKQYPDAYLVVVYDEINVNIGDIKCSYGRGDGGHNGLTSIIHHLDTKDFLRIRIGIRPVHDELLPRIAPPNGFETFMLAPFAPFEAELRDQALEKAVTVIEQLPFKSKDEIMNLYN